ERAIPSVSLHHSSGPPLRRRDSKREELARIAGGSSRWGSRRTDLPSPQTPRGVVGISFVAPALPAATRRSLRPSNGTIPCPVPTRDASRVGLLMRPADSYARRHPQLFQAEFEHVAQARRTLRQRRSLEQRLLLERRDVEVVGEEVHERLVVGGRAERTFVARLLPEPLDVEADERGDRLPQPGRQHARD